MYIVFVRPDGIPSYTFSYSQSYVPPRHELSLLSVLGKLCGEDRRKLSCLMSKRDKRLFGKVRYHEFESAEVFIFGVDVPKETFDGVIEVITSIIPVMSCSIDEKFRRCGRVLSVCRPDYPEAMPLFVSEMEKKRICSSLEDLVSSVGAVSGAIFVGEKMVLASIRWKNGIGMWMNGLFSTKEKETPCRFSIDGEKFVMIAVNVGLESSICLCINEGNYSSRRGLVEKLKKGGKECVIENVVREGKREFFHEALGVVCVDKKRIVRFVENQDEEVWRRIVLWMEEVDKLGDEEVIWIRDEKYLLVSKRRNEKRIYVCFEKSVEEEEALLMIENATKRLIGCLFYTRRRRSE